ncbi:MAG: hypothetical protein AB8B73_13505 [Ekhidna sp.]
MRKTILFFAASLSFLSLLAQTVSYKVLEDNPEKAYTKFIAPEFGMESNATDLAIFLGANARYGISDKLTLEGAARFDVYSPNSGSPTFLVEAGGFYPLKTQIKNKEVPVILSYNPTAGSGYKNGQRYTVEETKSITIPSGQYKNQYGVRAGLHYRSIGAQDDINGIAPGNINLAGLYIGGQMTSQAYVKTMINNDVERIGAGFTRIYADIFILPVTGLSDDTLAPATEGDGTFGWRVGFHWYTAPHDGDYKFLGNSILGAELGKRPLSGFMFNITWGYALNRS